MLRYGHGLHAEVSFHSARTSHDLKGQAQATVYEQTLLLLYSRCPSFLAPLLTLPSIPTAPPDSCYRSLALGTKTCEAVHWDNTNTPRRFLPSVPVQKSLQAGACGSKSNYTSLRIQPWQRLHESLHPRSHTGISHTGLATMATRARQLVAACGQARNTVGTRAHGQAYGITVAQNHTHNPPAPPRAAFSALPFRACALLPPHCACTPGISKRTAAQRQDLRQRAVLHVNGAMRVACIFRAFA